MGTYEDLKAAIQQVIRTNGNNEITGALLQQTLLSIVNSVGANAAFAGIATPNTNPGTADQNVFYLATEAGTYVNFGGIVINKGEAVILSNKTGSWESYLSGFANQQYVENVNNNTNPFSQYVLPLTKTYSNKVIELLNLNFGLQSKFRFRLIGTNTKSFTWFVMGDRKDNVTSDIIARKDIHGDFDIYIDVADYLTNINKSDYKAFRFQINSFYSSNVETFVLNSIETPLELLQGDVKDVELFLSKVDIFKLKDRNGLVLRGDIVGAQGSSSTTEFSTSDYIAIDDVFSIEYKNTFSVQPNNYFAGFVMYDETKTEIIYVGGLSGKVMLSDYPRAKYFRFCCPAEVELDECSITVIYNQKPKTNYELEESIEKVGDELAQLRDVLIVKQNHQLYNRNGLVLRGDIVGAQGSSSTTEFSTSDYIAITDGAFEIQYFNTFEIQPNNYFAGFVMYDETKTEIIYVGGLSGKVMLSDYPRAKYFRFCCPAEVELDDCSVVLMLISGGDGLTSVQTSDFIDTIADIENYMSTTGDSLYIGYDKVFSQNGILSEYIIELEGASQNDINSEFEFILGHIDQRNWLLPRITFKKKVNQVDGEKLIFDFSDVLISFRKNEVLFIRAKKTVLSSNNNIVAIHSGTQNILYTENLYDAVRVYGSGVEANIKITVKIIESYFASKEELQMIKDDVDRIDSALSKKQETILIDEANGNKYKITVNNGAIVLKLIQYSKILCIGNSFTKHGFVSGLWESNGRSMAASTNDTMYATIVAEKMNLQADRANLSDNEGSFERLLLDYDFNNLPNKSESYDAIIIQLGENIIETDDTIVANAFRELFNAVKSNWSNADIYMMFGTWRSQSQTISNVASEMNIPIINCGSVSLATPYQSKDYYIGDNGVYYEMADNVYRSHPSDVGMFNIAQKIIEAFGESAIDNKLFNITLNQTDGGTITIANDKWVAGGVVTVRCIANSGRAINNLSVISNGVNVDVIKRVGTYVAYTFIMPNGNVIINPTWN